MWKTNSAVRWRSILLVYSQSLTNQSAICAICAICRLRGAICPPRRSCRHLWTTVTIRTESRPDVIMLFFSDTLFLHWKTPRHEASRLISRWLSGSRDRHACLKDHSTRRVTGCSNDLQRHDCIFSFLHSPHYGNGRAHCVEKWCVVMGP